MLPNQLFNPKLTITFCYCSLGKIWATRHAVVSSLEKAGHRVKQIKDGPLDLTEDRIVLVWGNTNWYPGLFSQLTSIPRRQRPLVVLWHTEPLPPPKTAQLPWPRLNWWEAGKFLLRNSQTTDVYTNYLGVRRWKKNGLPDVLVGATPGRCEFLNERGMPAEWVPMGYEPSWYGHDLDLSRDIEVLFLGALDVPRRNRILRRLRNQGIPICAVGSYVDPNCWGDQRTTLLNRTKILLNLARTRGEFPDHRLILGMANKALVVSEPIYRPAPFVPGCHFISVSIEEMPEKIRYYLTHDEERVSITERAYDLVTKDVTMERSIGQILALINRAGVSTRTEGVGPVQ